MEEVANGVAASIARQVGASPECRQIAAYTSTLITPERAGSLDLRIIGNDGTNIDEAALLVGRVGERLLSEWREAERGLIQTEEAGARQTSRRGRFSSNVRRLLARRRSSAAGEEAIM